MTFGFRVERATTAPPTRVYDLLADAAAWREWVPFIGYSELIRRGTPDPLGAGAVRRVGVFKGVSVDEEIVEARPPHYQRYTGVRGFPVSQYCGEIRLSEVDNGTELLWTVSFEQRVPGTGRTLAMIFRAVITKMANRAISVAEESV
jgi:uncharacterized protein YndB with AHSA1/START domain